MLPPLTQIASWERISSRRFSGGHGNVVSVLTSARPREILVEPNGVLVAVGGRGRHPEHARPLLAGQPEDVVVEESRLVGSVATAAEADDVPLHRHRIRVVAHKESAGLPLFCFNRGMASPSKLTVGDRSYEIYRLDELQASYDVARLPYTLRVLLENVLRNGDEQDVDAVARWDAKAEPANEISFAPSRVLLQDLTGVPAVVDLAAMRNAMADLGGDPEKINPLIPAELVIDHSVQVDAFASRIAFGAERRARVRAQPRALPVPALGPDRVRRLQGRAARHGHLPPGEPRVPRTRRRGP